MTQKHTPAPWFPCRIVGTDNYSVRTNDHPEMIIIPVNKTDVNKSIHAELDETALANAKLIAAAPDLLQSCIDIVAHFDKADNDWLSDYEIGKLKSAINKAIL